MNIETNESEEITYGRAIYECASCGELARDPNNHINELNAAGFISCCPNSHYMLVREALPFTRSEERSPEVLREEAELMDKLAAAAMQVFLSAALKERKTTDHVMFMDAAAEAYMAADAMMIERKNWLK